MAFSLTIEFPMGFYQGHNASGEPELYPTPNRLYAALISAAFGIGVPKVALDVTLKAVTWMEGNPPDAVSLPEAVPSWHQEVVTYREKGLIKKDAKTKRISVKKLESERASQISALNGPVKYWWIESPSATQVQILAALAEEIPYIGERSSMARVFVHLDDEIPTEAFPLSKNHLLPDREAECLEYPEVGHFKELRDSYDAANPCRFPSENNDKYGTNEKENRFQVPRDHVGMARYRKPTSAETRTPWNRGFLVEVFKTERVDNQDPETLSGHEYVAWSVALHRAIIKQIGWSTPAIITGSYPKGVDQPANHMAIQVLPPGIRPFGTNPGDKNTFAVLFPPEATADEVELVRKALNTIRTLYLGKHGKLRLKYLSQFDPTKFWEPAKPGWSRLWAPHPAAICEIRGGQEGPNGGKWTVADALALSVGFVWRDKFVTPGLHGLSLYQNTVKQVIAEGISIQGTRKVHVSDISNYVHKHSISSVITPTTGFLDLSPICDGTELIAIGQSRHLGGGLLVPVDHKPEFDLNAGRNR